MGTVSKKFPGSRFSPCCFSTSKADGICVYGSKTNYIPSGYDNITVCHGKIHHFLVRLNHLFRSKNHGELLVITRGYENMGWFPVVYSWKWLEFMVSWVFLFVEDKTMNSKHSHRFASGRMEKRLANETDLTVYQVAIRALGWCTREQALRNGKLRLNGIFFGI